jgi:tRNA(fMet)-specific endonuclease VapC
MMAYLIDTDIIIFSLKGNEDVRRWMFDKQDIPKFISVVTYGELMYGARKSRHPEKNAATAKRIAELFPIIDITKEIIEVFGDIKARLELSGNRIEDMDLLIAATSIYRNMPLVTNNKRHFGRINDLVLERWEENEDS